MRISDATIVRNYMTTLGRKSEQRGSDALKVAAGRSFLTASDDPVAAIKAMQLRRSLSRAENFSGNIKELSGMLDEREAAVSEISDILTEISGLLIQGMSGTYSAGDRQSAAASLRACQQTVFGISNGAYCGKYIFGGELEDQKPFALDAMDKLCYQGIDVDSDMFPPERIDMDINFGAKMNRVCSGALMLGFGMDTDGLSNNICNFIGQVASAFESDDVSMAGLFTEKLKSIHGELTVRYAEIGAQSEFIELFGDRLTASQTNLTERQTAVEGADGAEAIMRYNQSSSVYDAALAMGAKMLPQTLMDYLSR